MQIAKGASHEFNSNRTKTPVLSLFVPEILNRLDSPSRSDPRATTAASILRDTLS